MNPVSTALFGIGIFGLVVGLIGGFGVLGLQLATGPPTCSGTNTICPTFALVEKGYKLQGWINGTYAPGVTIDNNPTGFDTTYIQISPSSGKGCSQYGGTCLLSFNVSTIKQSGGAIAETFSYAFPGVANLVGSYTIDAQILYTMPAGCCPGGTPARVSLYTATYPLTIPGNQSTTSCGNSCFTLSPGFSYATSGLFASFNDTSAVTTGAVANATWTFGDGGQGSGRSVTHVYASVGTYTVTEAVTAQVTGGVQQLFGKTTETLNITLGKIGGQTNVAGPPSSPFHPTVVDGVLIGASSALLLAAWIPKHPIAIAGAVGAGAVLGGFLL